MYHFQINDPHFLPHLGCNIEFSLSPGKMMTIVGENGIGKSTLAHRMWKSEVVNSSLVEQKPLDVFYDRPLSKIKNILLMARPQELSQKYFLSLWERFNLHKKEDRLHSTLSGGEAQALKICLGLAQKVPCFILDEPSQFLDREMKAVLSDVIAELLLEQKSIILIEHDYDWVKVPHTFIEVGNINGELREVKSWSI